MQILKVTLGRVQRRLKRIVDKLAERYNEQLDGKLFNTNVVVIFALTAVTHLPQLFAVLTASSVEGVSLITYSIVAYGGTVMIGYAIKNRRVDLFVTFCIAAPIAWGVVITVILRRFFLG